MKKNILMFITLLVLGCSNDSSNNDDSNTTVPDSNVSIDTNVSLQNDFSVICFLERGERYTLGVQDNVVQKDTSRVLISLVNNSRNITIKDYFSIKDKRHVAPNVFNETLISLGKANNEYIGFGAENFILPTSYYVMIDNYNVLFKEYLFNAGKNSYFSPIDYKKVKYGNVSSYTFVDRKTFGNSYKEYIGTQNEDGTFEFNSGYKVFFNEPGYLICEFSTSTGVDQNKNVLGSHKYVLKYKIYNKVSLK